MLKSLTHSCLNTDNEYNLHYQVRDTEEDLSNDITEVSIVHIKKRDRYVEIKVYLKTFQGMITLADANLDDSYSIRYTL